MLYAVCVCLYCKFQILFGNVRWIIVKRLNGDYICTVQIIPPFVFLIFLNFLHFLLFLLQTKRINGAAHTLIGNSSNDGEVGGSGRNKIDVSLVLV